MPNCRRLIVLFAIAALTAASLGTIRPASAQEPRERFITLGGAGPGGST